MVYKLAAFLVISHGDLARGRVFAQKGESICETLLGSDNPITIKFANTARDPSRDEKYGHSMRWKMPVDQVPHELGPHDFENWLWRREEPTDPPAKALIPSKQSCFSGFDDLPYKDDIGTNSSFKKRHWRFLGQVMEPILVVPLDLQVMDVHGKRLRVHFYTPQMGMYESSPQQAERGTHSPSSTRGNMISNSDLLVFYQDVRMLKTFPLPVAKIPALSNEVRQFPKPQHNNRRICHECGKRAAGDSMKRCTGCMSLWYCNKDCQMVGWVTKAHKACCKFLKDPDLRSLFPTEWDEVQDSVSFPLKVADGFC
ncbi:hypothetical protein E4U61_000346 [Claviceps capensis]|nr:hypothetical protein E4U61_000346 [Claviceps capensis]